MIPPGSSIAHAIDRYEAELRGRLRARLDAAETRDAAEKEIESLVQARELELICEASALGELPAKW